jgi:hypothetical protein
MYDKPSMPCFNYLLYLHGTKTITSLNAIL